MNVGVLAVQGDVPEHVEAVRRADPSARVAPVRSPSDLEGVDALLLPGGESTTIARLIAAGGLTEPLRRRLEDGLPALATCAGLILLARSIVPGSDPRDPKPLGVVDVAVRRNDYGRQRESFEGKVRVEGLGGEPFPAAFIRAPRIESLGPRARPIAWLGDEVVGVRTANVWGLTFHPELTNDVRLHRAFFATVRRA